MEIARAIKQARALVCLWQREYFNQAFWLGFAEMFGDYAWFINYMQSLEQVTPQDIMRIAQTYLQPSSAGCRCLLT
jgi:zinc protease